MEWPNLLIVAGTGRNVGKTTLACQIIQKASATNEVIGIKITPHQHPVEAGTPLLYAHNGAFVYQELVGDSEKDSSKMLAAGAKAVYFIQTPDAALPDVLVFLETLIPKSSAIVAESAALRNYIKPGLFVMLSKTGEVDKNRGLVSLADHQFFDFGYDPNQIEFTNGCWINRTKPL